ncbi:hypothetical protein RvY_00747 [Ramazzottius varieornatus]|uniref:alpha-1,2-Mannosidase n=1 Tax=Ramazzottius varieornatus TaxID=947166 RepID=A0A1D1UHI2_RAMVA|nr:hypothetical protein RvY_00747 [Ramazzottius varieornatus]
MPDSTGLTADNDLTETENSLFVATPPQPSEVRLEITNGERLTHPETSVASSRNAEVPDGSMSASRGHASWSSRRKLKWLVTAFVCLTMMLFLYKSMTGSRAGRSGVYVAPERRKENVYRKNYVKAMMKHAWDSYATYAWGDNELQPISRRGFHGSAPFGTARLGLTIIDSLDTLHLMGMQEELVRANEWLVDHYSIQNTSTVVSVFEANIRLVGGLLSMHALTGNNMYMRKAIETANALLPAFDSPSGLPYSLLDVSSGVGQIYSWVPGGCVFLADAGTLHLEFAYLSAITGNSTYVDKVSHVRNLLVNSKKETGFYPSTVDFLSLTGTKCTTGSLVTIGGTADSFYEYLLKAWLLSDQQDLAAKELFDEAMEKLEGRLLQSSQAALKYFAIMNEAEQLEHRVEHLACFVGGLYALNGLHSSHKARNLKLAHELTTTCRTSYASTKTRLGPESFSFNDLGQPAPDFRSENYALRPEVVESYFYLWKITGNEMYRDWAWDAAQAIDKHCRTRSGFTGIRDVDSLNPVPDDIQQSYFMAETLKYLYLVFLDDDILPLDTWVFNTEAHPLPVIGSEPFQRAYQAWTGHSFVPHRASRVDTSFKDSMQSAFLTGNRTFHLSTSTSCRPVAYLVFVLFAFALVFLS